jgi:RNA polymerase sigma-70 factor (ECF subfamily)
MDVYKDPQSHQTRRTLIDRLGHRMDADWYQFFDNYWRLIYNSALRAGLSPSDCEEVVQETVMAVFKQIDTFRYDPDRGRFRSWLQSITRNKIRDQQRKIVRQRKLLQKEADSIPDNIADCDESSGDSDWGEEWQKNLLHAALDNIKKKVDPKHFQVFHMINIEDTPIAEVSSFLGIGRVRIYLINHRIRKQVASEVHRLGKEII